MDNSGRWAKKEKDGAGFYTVDLVEMFFSKIDLRWLLVLLSKGEGREGRGGGRLTYIQGRAGRGVVEEAYIY